MSLGHSQSPSAAPGQDAPHKADGLGLTHIGARREWIKMIETVSVIIPTYNAERYIVGTLFSVLGQRHPGLIEVEILVVDDHSTDGTRSAAEAVAASYPAAIQVIRQQRNCGPAAARNRGLQAATGNFICFLDADDRDVPGFFAFGVEALNGNPGAAAIVTGVELVNCDGQIDPVQYEALFVSIASNVLIRTLVARLLGGFPEGDVFRGEAGLEDAAFKKALVDEFSVFKTDIKCLRYFVRPGGHFERFLDRTRVVDGCLVFNRSTQEERSGELALAERAYRAAIHERLNATSVSIPYRNKLRTAAWT